MPVEKEAKSTLTPLKSSSKKEKGRKGSKNRDRKLPVALRAEERRARVCSPPPAPQPPSAAALGGGEGEGRTAAEGAEGPSEGTVGAAAGAVMTGLPARV